MKKYIGVSWIIGVVVILGSAGSLWAQSIIKYPSGGEQVSAGEDHTVLWNPSAVSGNVSLSLWDGGHGTWTSVCTDIPASDGGAVWHVPSNLSGKYFRMKITSDSGWVWRCEPEHRLLRWEGSLPYNKSTPIK